MRRRSRANYSIKSIRFRLTALFVTIFGTTLILFSILLFREFTRSHQNEFDAALFNHAVDIAEALNEDFGDLSIRSSVLLGGEKFLPFSARNSLIEIKTVNGEVVTRSRRLGNYRLPFASEDMAALTQRGFDFRSLRARDLPKQSGEAAVGYRLLNYLVEKPLMPRLILQIAVPTTFLEKERAELTTFFAISVPAILFIATLGGLYLSRRALMPVMAIIDKAKSIGADQLSERVPVPDEEDEIRQLALTLNGLLNRLQLAFESQDRFISDASHQLKTPLSIIRGELDLMKSRARSPEEIASFLTSASQEVDYLTRMVEDLLLLARVDAGTAALSIQKMRLDEVALEAVSRLEPFAGRKGIKIRVDLREASGASASSAGFEMSGDPELLQCLVQNLIENAVKYSPEKSVVRVELSTEAGPEGAIVLQVEDQGPGIPLEARQRIFERFFRIDSTRQSAPGLGLGLALARRIAEAHDGTISVESPIHPDAAYSGGPGGGGTRFRVRIKKV